jgi:membrane-associated protease RseP (regulator of RpoE activity)
MVYIILTLVIVFVMNPGLSAIGTPMGITLQAINESYPAYEHFKERTFINTVNNVTILDAQDFVDAVKEIEPNKTVVLANDKQSFNIKAVSSPDNATKGFIGVTNFKNEFQFFNPVFGKTFIWIYNLFLFVAVLNLLVGLINLLPLGPIDGGRMMHLLLLKTMRNEAKAKKWWARISIATILILVLLLILPQILKWII